MQRGRSSLPPIVAYLDASVLHANGKHVDRFVGRGSEDSTGLNGETGTVTGANKLVSLDSAPGQRTAVMGAHILYRNGCHRG